MSNMQGSGGGDRVSGPHPPLENHTIIGPAKCHLNDPIRIVVRTPSPPPGPPSPLSNMVTKAEKNLNFWTPPSPLTKLSGFHLFNIGNQQSTMFVYIFCLYKILMFVVLTFRSTHTGKFLPKTDQRLDKSIGRSRGRDRVSRPPPTPTEKAQKYSVSKQYWSGSPEKSIGRSRERDRVSDPPWKITKI